LKVDLAKAPLDLLLGLKKSVDREIQHRASYYKVEEQRQKPQPQPKKVAALNRKQRRALIRRKIETHNPNPVVALGSAHKFVPAPTFKELWKAKAEPVVVPKAVEVPKSVESVKPVPEKVKKAVIVPKKKIDPAPPFVVRSWAPRVETNPLRAEMEREAAERVLKAQQAEELFQKQAAERSQKLLEDKMAAKALRAAAAAVPPPPKEPELTKEEKEARMKMPSPTLKQAFRLKSDVEFNRLTFFERIQYERARENARKEGRPLI
jgi:hypothetical protein